jgi:hypothetical protein
LELTSSSVVVISITVDLPPVHTAVS